MPQEDSLEFVLWLPYPNLQHMIHSNSSHGSWKLFINYDGLPDHWFRCNRIGHKIAGSCAIFFSSLCAFNLKKWIHKAGSPSIDFVWQSLGIFMNPPILSSPIDEDVGLCSKPSNSLEVVAIDHLVNSQDFKKSPNDAIQHCNIDFKKSSNDAIQHHNIHISDDKDYLHTFSKNHDVF